MIERGEVLTREH